MSVSKGQEKMQKHRDRAMKGGMLPSDYAKLVDLSPQRISSICSGRADYKSITVAEAYKLQDKARIRVSDWVPN